MTKAWAESEIELMENERVDDLQYKGLRIIQNRKSFCFGVDAVLLAHFADVHKGDAVLDMGTGTGIIPLLIAGRTEAAWVTGLEIQAEMAGMANRSVLMNGLQHRVRIVEGDIRRALEIFKPSGFQVVVSNPPYMNSGGGLLNPAESKAISRHELLLSLEDVIVAGSRLLAPGGQFAMVHRPSRLVDIVYLMRVHGLEPKEIRMVHPSPYKRANLLLIKGTRGGRPQLKMMEPLYVYDENGKYTREINEIYGR